MRKGLKTLEEEIHEEANNDIEEEFSFDALPEMDKYESIQLRQLESNPPQIVPQNSNVSFITKDNSTLEGVNSQKSYISTILQKEPSKFARLNRNQSLVNPYERDFGSFEDLIKGEKNAAENDDNKDSYNDEEDDDNLQRNEVKNYDNKDDQGIEFEDDAYRNDEMKEIQLRGKFQAFEDSRNEYDVEDSESDKIDLDNRSEKSQKNEQIDMKVDDRDQEISKLSKGEEMKALQSLDEWVQVSKNNLKLRLMLRQTRGEQLREKAISKKQTSAWVLIHDRQKRKMKKILQQQANLVDFCKETKRMYEGAVDAMKKTTIKLTQSQEKCMKANKELSENQSKELVIRNSLREKELELKEVKDELRVLKEEIDRIRGKEKEKDVIQNENNMMITDEKQKELKDVTQQDKNQQYQEEFEDYARLLTEALMDKQKLQEQLESKNQQIQKLNVDLIASSEWQAKYRCTEDELQLIKSNNKQLVIQINNKQAQIEQYQMDSLRNAQISKDNQELKNSVNLLSQQLMQKHTLMIEQEVMHSVALKQAQQKQTPLNNEQHLREKLQNVIEVESINSPNNLEDDDKKVAMKQKILMKQLFGWDLILDSVEEENYGKLIAVNSNSGLKPFALDVFLPDSQIINRQALLENADQLMQMIAQQPQAITAIASCTENYWLLAASLLKQYLDQSTMQGQNEGQGEEEQQQNYEDNTGVQEEGQEEIGDMFYDEEDDNSKQRDKQIDDQLDEIN